MSPSPELQLLLERLRQAHGHDVAFDQAIAHDLDVLAPVTQVPEYTASVDRYLELLHRLLPAWRWHLGYGASGVMPYAFVSDGGRRFEAGLTHETHSFLTPGANPHSRLKSTQPAWASTGKIEALLAMVSSALARVEDHSPSCVNPEARVMLIALGPFQMP